jgi:streptogramin lyase
VTHTNPLDRPNSPRSRSRCAYLVLLALILPASSRTAQAIELRPGDVLTSGDTFFFDGDDFIHHPAVVHTDPVTRVSTYLSGAGVGNGPALTAPQGIAVRGNRDVFVANGPTILRIDPATGDRTIVSGPGVGSGAIWQAASGAWLRDDQSLLLVDRIGKSIMSVDLLTGDRTIVSSSTVGSGPNFIDPVQLTTTLDGRILVTSYGTRTAEDEYHGMVLSVDPATGNREILSDATHGGGPGYISPIGIARRANGKILVTDDWPAKVFELDPATGAQSIVTESVPPATPVPNQFISPRGVTEAPDGTVFFVDIDNSLMRVSVNDQWASRVQVGLSIDVGQSNFITAVQVPEPAAIISFAIGVVGLLVATKKFSRR